MLVKNSRTVALVLHPAIEHAANVVDRVWHAVVGQHARCTGLGEEGHSKRSKHYGELGDVRCRAIDIDGDTDHLPPHLEAKVMKELKARLPRPEYDVVFEGRGKVWAHVHIEFDPKPVES